MEIFHFWDTPSSQEKLNLGPGGCGILGEDRTAGMTAETSEDQFITVCKDDSYIERFESEAK